MKRRQMKRRQRIWICETKELMKKAFIIVGMLVTLFFVYYWLYQIETTVATLGAMALSIFLITIFVNTLTIYVNQVRKK